MLERRIKRSHSPLEALTLLVESQRRSLGAHALSVATRDGTVLAASYADGTDEPNGRESVDAAPIATWALQVGADELVIRSVGGRLSHEIGSGVRRIGHP